MAQRTFGRSWTSSESRLSRPAARHPHRRLAELPPAANAPHAVPGEMRRRGRCMSFCQRGVGRPGGAHSTGMVAPSPRWAGGADGDDEQAVCERPGIDRWVGKSPVGAVESKTPWLPEPLEHTQRRGTSAHTGHPSANAGLTALCRADFHGSATGDELHMARRGFLLNLAPATVYLAWTP